MIKPVLFIDTDMGVDDIVALCMLTGDTAYTICGISLVNGVATVTSGSVNIVRILKALNRRIPIYLGADESMQKSPISFPARDRERANLLRLMEGVRLPDTGNTFLSNIKELQKKIELQPRKITLLAIGPLTNVAMILASRAAKEKIARLYIMGGTIYVRGNVPPDYEKEYNFQLDQKAARLVLSSQIPITLVPLDATCFVPAKDRNFIQSLKNIRPKTSEGDIMKAILLNNETDFHYFYDPLAAAIMTNPSIVTKYEQKGSVTIVLSIDNLKFYKYMLRLIERDKI